MSFTYTVGIKGKSCFWKNYKVLGHKLNTDIPGSVRLALTMPDRSVIIIPEFDRKYFKLHSDFHLFNEHLTKLKATVTQPVMIKEEPNAELRE